MLGDVIENTAAIYFDFNPPIITNTVEHVVDFSTAVVDHTEVTRVEAWPNPTTDFLNIVLRDPRARILGVFDMSGTQVRLPLAKRSNGAQMDVQGLPIGIYAISTTAGSVRFVRQ